nr:helix-turn-helix domain-containing protein [uncultured Undibacterium sp.]
MDKQIVYFIVLPDILLIDLAGPADAFLFANRRLGEVQFDLRYISPSPSISSSIGLSLGNLSPLPETIEEQALIMIPGVRGDNFDQTSLAARQTIKWLRQHCNASHRIACVCAGALVAAHAGLLKNKRATTHHSHCIDLAKIDASIQVEENRIFVEDGKVLTSAGVTAGIDLSLHLISQICSPKTAMAVARAMVVYFRRSGNDPQLSAWLQHRNHLHPTVHKIQDLISRDPTHPWNLDELAGHASTSSRHLTRLFKLHAQTSVYDYLTSLRLSLADQLLSQTDWSIERIADAAGFGSARQFRRCWQTAYKTSPSHYQQLQ